MANAWIDAPTYPAWSPTAPRALAFTPSDSAVYATALLLAVVMHHWVLCFLHGKGIPVSVARVAMAEVLIYIACVPYLLARLSLRSLIAVFAVFGACGLLALFRGGYFDAKSARDLLIPMVFVWAGRAFGQKGRSLDRPLLVVAGVVVAIGLVQAVAADAYNRVFNTFNYYVNLGGISTASAQVAGQAVTLNGMRPEGIGRTLLPQLLGAQRVASVFLEPVSMGNFGAIIYAWGLFRSDYRYRWFLIAAALAMIILADARFGLGACIVMTVLSPFFRFIPRQIWLVVPFLMLSVFAAFGLITGANPGPDDLAGRFSSTSHLITSLPAGAVLGYEAYEKFTADSGFAYTLTQFAIWGFVGLWATFVMLPCRDARGWQFHSMMIVYLLLILIISNSFYSVKTAALMFFILGTANAVRLPEVQSRWGRLFAKKGEEAVRR